AIQKGLAVTAAAQVGLEEHDLRGRVTLDDTVAVVVKPEDTNYKSQVVGESDLQRWFDQFGYMALDLINYERPVPAQLFVDLSISKEVEAVIYQRTAQALKKVTWYQEPALNEIRKRMKQAVVLYIWTSRLAEALQKAQGQSLGNERPTDVRLADAEPWKHFTPDEQKAIYVMARARQIFSEGMKDAVRLWIEQPSSELRPEALTPETAVAVLELIQDKKLAFSGLARRIVDALKAEKKLSSKRLTEIDDAINLLQTHEKVALLEKGSDSVIDGLMISLKSGKVPERSLAAAQLGSMASKKAVPALTVAMSDEDSFVRFNAIVALGKIGGAPATQAVVRLAEALRDEKDPNLRRAAAASLERIGYPTAVLAIPI
ncbi:MAG: HEAT repeat domain-containing protein, partial [Terriglobia bacterium]